MYGIERSGLILVEGGWGPTFGALNGFRKPIAFKTPKEAEEYMAKNCFCELGTNVVHLPSEEEE